MSKFIQLMPDSHTDGCLYALDSDGIIWKLIYPEYDEWVKLEQQKPKKKVDDVEHKKSISTRHFEQIDLFWAFYPNKKGKDNVRKWFSTNPPSSDLFNTIIVGLTRAKHSEEWAKDNGKYIPHPTTWLNRHGWEDEYVERPDSWQYTEGS